MVPGPLSGREASPAIPTGLERIVSRPEARAGGSRPGVEGCGEPGHVPGMSRTSLALVVGLLGVFLYVIAVVSLADLVIGTHWVLEAVYYLVAGVAWAVPAKWLVAWAVRGAAREG